MRDATSEVRMEARRKNDNQPRKYTRGKKDESGAGIGGWMKSSALILRTLGPTKEDKSDDHTS